jgi:hypothetical protein
LWKEGLRPFFIPICRHSREACPVLNTGTGIQKDIARHYFWIPTYVGMTKRLKNNTYDKTPIRGEGINHGLSRQW